MAQKLHMIVWEFQMKSTLIYLKLALLAIPLLLHLVSESVSAVLAYYLIVGFLIYTMDKMVPIAGSNNVCKDSAAEQGISQLSAISLDRHVRYCNNQSEKRSMAYLIRIRNWEEICSAFGTGDKDLAYLFFADRISCIIRRCDMISRKKDNEVLVIISLSGDCALAEQITRRLQNTMTEPIHMDSRQIPVIINIGICPVGKCPDSASLLKNCSQALAEAEKIGPNSYLFFDRSGRDKRNRTSLIEACLKKALKNNELEMFLQPEVSTETGEIISVESLIRWDSPVLGKVNPQEFIPIAEKCGLINEVSSFVYKESFRMLRELQGSGFPHICISINVSPAEFRDNMLIDNILFSLLSSDVDPGSVDLEITEGYLLPDDDIVLTAMFRLKSMGFNISIDDFGTGYSSINYLKQYQFDKVKIDKSYVDNIQNDDNCRALVKALINMSKALNLLTIAEGVENVAQAEILKALGCDVLQGYYFSEPLCFQDFNRFLKSSSRSMFGTEDSCARLSVTSGKDKTAARSEI